MANGVLKGNGTFTNPYLIEDAHDLNAIRNYLGNTSVHFKQVANIDLSSWGNWEPIQNGTSTSNNDVFRGHYDGGGYKISNMTCQHDRNYVGLFGYVNGATINNVFIENCNVSGNSSVGGLIGEDTYSDISNCYSSGIVRGNNNVGGLIGDLNSTILNCYSIANVSGNDYVGGLIGDGYGGTASNCYASGNVSGNSSVGGLIGYGSTRASNCYASGNVSGNSSVGGLIGYSRSALSNCYASGDVSGNSGVGGLAGRTSSGSFIISNCYASGNVSGNSGVGGLVGTNSVRISNSYALNPIIFRNSGSTYDNFGDIVGHNGGTIENCYSLNTLEFRQL